MQLEAILCISLNFYHILPFRRTSHYDLDNREEFYSIHLLLLALSKLLSVLDLNSFLCNLYQLIHPLCDLPIKLIIKSREIVYSSTLSNELLFKENSSSSNNLILSFIYYDYYFIDMSMRWKHLIISLFKVLLCNRANNCQLR